MKAALLSVVRLRGAARRGEVVRERMRRRAVFMFGLWACGLVERGGES